MQGKTLGGRYAVQRMLGEGGMGAVYEARHTGTGRRVALKVITAPTAGRKDLLARFELEAKAAGQVESRHIAQVLDVGSEGEQPYLVMEFLEGEDLMHLIRRLGPLPRSLAVRIVAQACAGLDKAHAKGIIHRDIKPANIFLAQQDGDVVVKILDFGVAKMRPDAANSTDSADLTRTGSLLGSPLYMSPEQARGLRTIDQRTDLWSLGIVLYQALSGYTPFHEVETMGELILTICGTPAPNVQDRAPWVDPAVARVVARALEIDAKKRFQTAAEMLQALRDLEPGPLAIDGGMIAPLSQGESGVIAPRATTLDQKPPPPATSSPSLADAQATAIVQASSSASAARAGSTTAAVASERKPSKPPKSSRGPIVGVAVGAIGLVAAIAVYVTRPSASADPGPAPPRNATTQSEAVGTSAQSPPQNPTAQSKDSPTNQAPTSAPSVVPAETTAAATADPKATAQATGPKGGARPTATAAPSAKPTAAATASPTTPAASVSGRIIRTDLP